MKIVNLWYHYSRLRVNTRQPASQPVRPVHLELCVKMISTKQFWNELHQKLSWMSTLGLFRQPDDFIILPPWNGPQNRSFSREELCSPPASWHRSPPVWKGSPRDWM
ncbi:hypothetical protein CHARACLAT_023235 [Characodon lateralis]|uniref:Uncharacterized protein n=1 Tax=Characodon lateralis TaxID=208331 RepID=A0ABU7CSW0_9TELE|nr:hypothetical protein [Characodon lateralis]